MSKIVCDVFRDVQQLAFPCGDQQEPSHSLKQNTFNIARLEQNTFNIARLEQYTFNIARLEQNTFSIARLEQNTFSIARSATMYYKIILLCDWRDSLKLGDNRILVKKNSVARSNVLQDHVTV